MTRHVRISDCLIIDVSAVVAMGVHDGEGFIALQGGHRYTLPIATLDRIVQHYLAAYPLDETVTVKTFVDQEI